MIYTTVTQIHTNTQCVECGKDMDGHGNSGVTCSSCFAKIMAFNEDPKLSEIYDVSEMD